MTDSKNPSRGPDYTLDVPKRPKVEPSREPTLFQMEELETAADDAHKLGEKRVGLKPGCAVPGHKLHSELLKVGLPSLDGGHASQTQMWPFSRSRRIFRLRELDEGAWIVGGHR